MYYFDLNAVPVKELVKGVRLKAIYGEKIMMSFVTLDIGAVVPEHKHPHEQTGYLVSGRMDLTIGDVTHQVLPGDSWCIPGDIEHHAVAHERSVAVEVFSPVREDYLP